MTLSPSAQLLRSLSLSNSPVRRKPQTDGAVKALRKFAVVWREDATNHIVTKPRPSDADAARHGCTSTSVENPQHVTYIIVLNGRAYRTFLTFPARQGRTDTAAMTEAL
jgi:hypothetical protein